MIYYNEKPQALQRAPGGKGMSQLQIRDLLRVNIANQSFPTATCEHGGHEIGSGTDVIASGFRHVLGIKLDFIVITAFIRHGDFSHLKTSEKGMTLIISRVLAIVHAFVTHTSITSFLFFSLLRSRKVDGTVAGEPVTIHIYYISNFKKIQIYGSFLNRKIYN